MTPYDVIRRPRITEKAVYQQEVLGQYTFEVAPAANKSQIKAAIEQVFGVQVLAVKTMNYAGPRRRVGRSVGYGAAWKKALVKLAEGQSIEGV